MPEELVVLDGEEFVKSLRNSRRGAAPGPSGMCAEHLRLLLDRESDVMAITMFGNSFARGQIPSDIVAAVRLGRMTALQKPDGGVRGIVVGDYFRRLVSRTLAKQFAQNAEDCRHLQSSVTAPRSFQWTEWGLTTSCQGQQCSADSWTWRKVTDCCHLSVCSILIRPFSCGMTKLETPTRSGKEREENKEMR